MISKRLLTRGGVGGGVRAGHQELSSPRKGLNGLELWHHRPAAAPEFDVRSAYTPDNSPASDFYLHCRYLSDKEIKSDLTLGVLRLQNLQKFKGTTDAR
jgi:hypothetical protein